MRLSSRPAVAVLAAVILGLFLVYPLGSLLYDVFFASGALSAGSPGAALGDPAVVRAIRNTLVLVAASGGLALVIGSAFAWLNERTDARLGLVGEVIPVVPLLMPPVAGAIGWVLLLSPNAGLINVGIRAIAGHGGDTGVGGPVNVYTFVGLILVSTLYLVPYVYLTMASAFRNLDTTLEEASRVCGRGVVTTFFRVVLPSVRLSLAAAAILVLMVSVAAFAVPLIIGIGARIDVISVLIFDSLNTTFPPHIGEAVVLSTILLLGVQVGVLAQYFLARSRHAARMEGQAHVATPVRLGMWRPVARSGLVAYMVCSTALPFLGLLLVSLQRFWSPQIDWAKLSLASYAHVFEGSTTTQALINSLWIAAAGATIALGIGITFALFMQHTSRWYGHAVNIASALPAGVPHIVIAIAFIVTFSVLAGSPLLLIIAYVVLFLPLATRSAVSAVGQVGRSLVESSAMCGATPTRTFMRILAPLMAGSLVAGWVILFAVMFSEVTASVFLAGVGDPVVGPVMYNLFSQGANFPELAALSLIVTVVNTLVVLVALKLARRGQIPTRGPVVAGPMAGSLRV